MHSLLCTTTRKLGLAVAALVVCFAAASAPAQIDPSSPAAINWTRIAAAGAPTAPCPTSTVTVGQPYVDTTNNRNYTCGPSGWFASSSSSGAGLPECSDVSGSGTVQACSTSPAFTPAANQSCILYHTTTANSGTGLTANVNSLGAKPVAIAGASGWTTTLTAGVIASAKPVAMCYDGTNWDVLQTGKASSGGGTLPSTTQMLAGDGAGNAAVTAMDDGHTTAGVVTSTEPIVVSGATQGVLVASGTAKPGVANAVIYASDATTGYGEINENNSGLSRICTAGNAASNSGCQGTGGFSLPFMSDGFFAVADTTAPTVTSSSRSVAIGQVVMLSGRGAGSSTIIDPSSSCSDFTGIWHKLGVVNPSGLTHQMSWAVAPSSESCTFSITQSSSAAGISLIGMIWTPPAGGFNTGSITSSTGSNSGSVSTLTITGLTTSSKALLVECGALGNLARWNSGVIGGGNGVVAAESQTSLAATNADAGCQYFVSLSPLVGADATFNTSAAGAFAATFMAVPFS